MAGDAPVTLYDRFLELVIANGLTHGTAAVQVRPMAVVAASGAARESLHSLGCREGVFSETAGSYDRAAGSNRVGTHGRRDLSPFRLARRLPYIIPHKSKHCFKYWSLEEPPAAIHEMPKRGERLR